MKTETIYVDSLCHCHRIDDGTMTSVETAFFYGKCDTWVEGFCYDTIKGYVQIYPWKPYSELDKTQREYERQRVSELEAENETLLADMAQLVEEVYQSDVEMMGI